MEFEFQMPKSGLFSLYEKNYSKSLIFLIFFRINLLKHFDEIVKMVPNWFHFGSAIHPQKTALP